ncbi:hypothetical protein SPRG_06692 [Saprolegnia parasitica CBS 223.65]|uniref:Pentacotripeptide-repeat region of PRORP domain-containing protein n=1 Tax=Saprolegnia parasitica (strain CBS 223.65) TaxID=695850 RepID=A0A067CCF6_SAPPC|nr:hypothetical protein SPRG_06692 [Saprolegnia parasitica CBS 223.65]KDO28454.1 hypothetical protein SPRG_06692 [Saprolegnia parasitica CBS 223.65]|eukprot:XP_012200894.1 hypothetical protein SPRG_06692 [Saprolegnia parasitica CBS 223.65]
MLRSLVSVPRRWAPALATSHVGALRCISDDAAPPLRQLKIKPAKAKKVKGPFEPFVAPRRLPADKALPRDGDVSAQMAAHVQAHRYDDALSLFAALPTKSIDSYRWAMEAHAALFDYAQVVELYMDAAMAHDVSNEMRLLYVVALNRQKKFAHTLAAFADWHYLRLPLSTAIFTAVLTACGHTKDWARAQFVANAMQEAGLSLQGVAYFHILSAALRDPTVHALTSLELAEAATSAGYPVSTSLLGQILILSAKHASQLEQKKAKAVWGRARRVWDANKSYGAITGRHEFQYEVLMQALWKLKYKSDVTSILHDLLSFPHSRADFKARLLKDLFNRHVEDADMAGATAIVDLMQAHGVGLLTTLRRHKFFSLCVRNMPIDETRAIFTKYESVLGGWNAEGISGLLIWGHKATTDNDEDDEHELEHQYKQVQQLVSDAFDHGWSLSYPAMDHTAHWLLHLHRYEDCVVFVNGLMENPNFDVGYRITEAGMVAAKRLGDNAHVTELYRQLEARHRANPSTQAVTFAPRPLMLWTAIGAFEALGQFEDARLLKAMLTQLHPHKAPYKNKKTPIRRARRAVFDDYDTTVDV